MVSSGLTRKTPKPNWGIVLPLFSMTSGIAVTAVSLLRLDCMLTSVAAQDGRLHPWVPRFSSVFPASPCDSKDARGGAASFCAGMTGGPTREDRCFLPYHAAPLLRPFLRAARNGPCNEPAQTSGEHSM